MRTIPAGVHDPEPYGSRLFAGFALPITAQQRLSALRLRLAQPSDGLRWTTSEQWHLTLKYFGELLPPAVTSILDSFQRLKLHPPRLRMESLGFFASKGILFAAIQPSSDLLAFQAALASQVTPADATERSLPFHPHITLARSKGKIGHKTLVRLQKANVPFGPAMEWTPDAVLLYRSVLEPHGATYLPVATRLLPATRVVK